MSNVITGRLLFFLLVLLLYLAPAAHAASIIDSSADSINGLTYGAAYDFLLSTMLANDAVVTSIDGKLWVPWYSTSSSCELSDLHNGASCNSGETIDAENNCMVTDELSQVGLLVSMGSDAEVMRSYYFTLQAIQSTNGVIPAWRIYRDGSSIEPCREGINGNCDTASDATARILISLFNAANNDNFPADDRSQYLSFAENLLEDFVEYELVNTCYSSSIANRDVCYWLASGSSAKRGGLASTDFGYTGYYADAVIALLQGCTLVDVSYCTIAEDIMFNYLQASYPEGTSLSDGFRVPPGRSFRWVNLEGVPRAECTNTCGPTQWDPADAPRAYGMCQVLYYSRQIGYSLPALESYCELWGDAYLTDPLSLYLQFSPDGLPSGSSQSSYYAQGLQALFYSGYSDALFTLSLNSALDHFSFETNTFDYQSCFGIYNQAFLLRALGVGMGSDLAAFPSLSADSIDALPDAIIDLPFGGENLSFLDGFSGVTLEVVPPFPRETASGEAYLFDCVHEDISDQVNSLQYSWELGFDSSQTSSSELYYEFEPGSYSVSCSVSLGGVLYADSINVVVGSDSQDVPLVASSGSSGSSGGGASTSEPLFSVGLRKFEELFLSGSDDAQLTSVVRSYFSGSAAVASTDLVFMIRDYFGEDQKPGSAGDSS